MSEINQIKLHLCRTFKVLQHWTWPCANTTIAPRDIWCKTSRENQPMDEHRRPQNQIKSYPPVSFDGPPQTFHRQQQYISTALNKKILKCFHNFQSSWPGSRSMDTLFEMNNTYCSAFHASRHRHIVESTKHSWMPLLNEQIGMPHHPMRSYYLPTLCKDS